MTDDTPIVLVLLALGGLAFWLVHKWHPMNVPSKPDAPPGEPVMPLAPACVAPSLRWLLVPSQEE